MQIPGRAIQVLSRQSRRGETINWRKKMIRKSFYALAAALMTLGTFSSTVAVMTVNSDSAAQIA